MQTVRSAGSFRTLSHNMDLLTAATRETGPRNSRAELLTLQKSYRLSESQIDDHSADWSGLKLLINMAEIQSSCKIRHRAPSQGSNQANSEYCLSGFGNNPLGIMNIYIYIFCTRVQSGLGRNNWLTHMYFYAPLIGRKKSCFWLWFISENREKGWKSQGTNSGSNSTELCVLKLNLPIVSLLKRCLIVCATGSIVCSLCAYSQPTQYCTCSNFLSLTFLYSFVKEIILRRWDSVQDGVQTHPLIILRDYNVAERFM